MTDRDPITLISQAIDMLEDDLEGHPLHIERPGKEDFVLVSSQTYSDLITRIHDLEQAAMSDEDLAAEEEILLRAMVDATNSGRLH